jgi:hypothetical protein
VIAWAARWFSLRVAGFGHIYFLRARHQASVIEPGKPLSVSGIEVWRAGAGDHFDLKQWKGAGGIGYELRVVAGSIVSTQSGGAVY